MGYGLFSDREMDHSNSMGGGDVDEARRRAEHRGGVYQC